MLAFVRFIKKLKFFLKKINLTLCVFLRHQNPGVKQNQNGLLIPYSPSEKINVKLQTILVNYIKLTYYYHVFDVPLFMQYL